MPILKNTILPHNHNKGCHVSDCESNRHARDDVFQRLLYTACGTNYNRKLQFTNNCNGWYCTEGGAVCRWSHPASSTSLFLRGRWSLFKIKNQIKADCQFIGRKNDYAFKQKKNYNLEFISNKKKLQLQPYFIKWNKCESHSYDFSILTWKWFHPSLL